MSAYWNGNLCNTPVDVLIDTTILVLSVCAYIPQVSRVRNGLSTHGISAYYILFHVFFSNAQLSQALLTAAFAWPTDSRPILKELSTGSLKGLRAFSGILGLLQIFVQWACSIAVLVSFATGSQDGDVNAKTTFVIAFIHCAAVMVPAAALSLPKPSAHSFEKDIMMALIGFSNLVVAPSFVVLQFCAQFLEMRSQHGHTGALSLFSICLQMLAISAIGFRWLLRLGRPPWGFVPAPIGLWYQWGFPAANYMLHAVGCAIILTCYSFAGRGALEYGDLGDRMPLLV